MKAVVTIKLKEGYMILEMDVGAIVQEDLLTSTVVGTDSYSYRDKVGRVAVDILEVKEAIPVPPPEPEKDKENADDLPIFPNEFVGELFAWEKFGELDFHCSQLSLTGIKYTASSQYIASRYLAYAKSAISAHENPEMPVMGRCSRG